MTACCAFFILICLLKFQYKKNHKACEEKCIFMMDMNFVPVLSTFSNGYVCSVWSSISLLQDILKWFWLLHMWVIMRTMLVKTKKDLLQISEFTFRWHKDENIIYVIIGSSKGEVRDWNAIRCWNYLGMFRKLRNLSWKKYCWHFFSVSRILSVDRIRSTVLSQLSEASIL